MPKLLHCPIQIALLLTNLPEVGLLSSVLFLLALIGNFPSRSPAPSCICRTSVNINGSFVVLSVRRIQAAESLGIFFSFFSFLLSLQGLALQLFFFTSLPVTTQRGVAVSWGLCGHLRFRFPRVVFLPRPLDWQLVISPRLLVGSWHHEVVLSQPAIWVHSTDCGPLMKRVTQEAVILREQCPVNSFSTAVAHHLKQGTDPVQPFVS